MEIFSFSKGFRLYKLLIKCESLLLLTPTFLLLLSKPTISEACKSTGLTVWSNICIQILYEKIKQKKTPVVYNEDKIANLHGHEVLRITVRHCELNPI
jgi:hypothetical protein